LVPDLLWRCPLCKCRDALEHTVRIFRKDEVHCTNCSAVWRVRRAVSDNFYLQLVHPGGAREHRAGMELSITSWYDEMKKDLHLEPCTDPAFGLNPGETLYLASKRVELRVEEGDPLFFPKNNKATTRLDKREIGGIVIGLGRLFLTDRRFIWQKEPHSYDFSLTQVNSVYALMNVGMTMMVGMRLYMFRFLDESLLKWITHSALVAEIIFAASGHRITTSNF
jgi:hypothetical protein